ncbi:MAG: TRAP transporter substrate-binding protein [Lachnospiraceae bacterium]|nr:TRAP transporter substrate-binding protein [Lachnospiraceae bacterium]MDE6981843.1 TRAP transporter substrate-binding protein [Lachnospiraceae bacterium]
MYSRIKKALPLILSVLALAGYINVGNRVFERTEPEYVLSYGENQGEDYPTTMGAYRFAQLVEEQTEGRIKILVTADGGLGQEAEVIWQMQHGGVDFARVSLSQLSAMDKGMNVLQLPYLYVNSAHMWRVLDGVIGDAFMQRVESYDLVGLSWYDAGARCFYNNLRPITSPKDMEGMLIRVQQADMMVDMVEMLGAAAAPISYEEVYSSLERGKVDGAENNWPSYESMNHNEVAKYFTVDEHTRIPEIQLCSKHTWEKLKPEDREIILTCARESALYERELWKKREKESMEKVVGSGTVVTELSQEEKEAFRRATYGIYEEYCGDYMDIVDEIRKLGDGS